MTARAGLGPVARFARAELARCHGSQLDPKVADAFARITLARLREVHERAPRAHALATGAS